MRNVQSILPFQMVVEREVEAEGLDRRTMGREAFTDRVWSWQQRYGSNISRQLRRLGASCDWSRERFTLDAQLSGPDNAKQQICIMTV